MQNQLSNLTQKEMTRKEFLTAVGIGLGSIMGLSSIIKLVTDKGIHRTKGYGSNTYGR